MKPWQTKHRWRWSLALLPLLLLAFVARQNAKRPQRLAGLGGAPIALAYSPDGKTLVCASDNQYIQMWKPDIKKWRSFRSESYRDYAGPPSVGYLHFSRDGQALYGTLLSDASSFGGRGTNLPKWTVATRRAEQVFQAISGSAFDISPDEHWAASTSTAPRLTLDILDMTREYKPNSKYPLPPNHRYFFRLAQTALTRQITALAFAPNSSTLAAWDGANEVTLYDVPNGTAQRTLAIAHPAASPGFKFPLPAPAALAWSPDGQWLAAYHDTQLQIWNIETGQTHNAIAPLPGNGPTLIGAQMDTLAWSPDGKRVATGGASVALWSVPDLKSERHLRAQGGVAFSPDGRTLATGGNESAHEVLLWPLQSWPF